MALPEPMWGGSSTDTRSPSAASCSCSAVQAIFTGADGSLWQGSPSLVGLACRRVLLGALDSGRRPLYPERRRSSARAGLTLAPYDHLCRGGRVQPRNRHLRRDGGLGVRGRHGGGSSAYLRHAVIGSGCTPQAPLGTSGARHYSHDTRYLFTLPALDGGSDCGGDGRCPRLTG